LKRVEDSYRRGELLTGELKKMAITLLQDYVKEFQERRKEVTDEILKQFMTPRQLEWKGNPNPKPKEKKAKESKEEKAKASKEGSDKNQAKN
jgi:tryptophanyl-tRNA synthetase